ncbi:MULTISPECIES: DUF6136 family protein [Pseudoalteromonas]|uniref:DUF6136 family protein n=1 Tax=Pseudoalteromonas TaxID=53246 RepID=UPI00036966DF|nr:MULTISPECIES: DUF6136 family protein [Pseudoalteromonas]TMN67476.1 hypothetical protein CWB85_19325 [Pseudoalteromonas sp. S1727]
MSKLVISSTITQYRAFMDYRYQAYKIELTQLLQQLKNFGLLFLVVLGSAMLGMILLLFLGLGKIIDSSEAPQYGAQMAWLYLLLQSVMLSAMKSAIKNSQQRLFQYTIVRSTWLACMDIKLLLLSNAWLLASAVIALDLTFTQWLRAPHFILFMLLQFGLGVLCLYKPRALIYGLGFTAVLVLLPINITSLVYHSSFIVLFALSMLLPVFLLNDRLSVNSLFTFWLSFFIQHCWVLVWRVALLLCVFMATTTLLLERADLAAIFSVLALAFIVLFTSSLQFDCGKLHDKYSLFFQANNQQRWFFISQFIPSCLFFFITLLSYLLFVAKIGWLLLSLSVVWCAVQLYIAQKKPAHYALAWMVITGLLLALIA